MNYMEKNDTSEKIYRIFKSLPRPSLEDMLPRDIKKEKEAYANPLLNTSIPYRLYKFCNVIEIISEKDNICYYLHKIQHHDLIACVTMMKFKEVLLPYKIPVEKRIFYNQWLVEDGNNTIIFTDNIFWAEQIHKTINTPFRKMTVVSLFSDDGSLDGFDFSIFNYKCSQHCIFFCKFSVGEYLLCFGKQQAFIVVSRREVPDN